MTGAVGSLVRPGKILMVSGRADIGGGPEHILQLAKGLSSDFEIHVACPRERPYWSRFSSLPNVSGMTEIPKRSADIRTMRAIASSIRDFRPDIVHTHGKAAGVAARIPVFLRNAAHVHTLHGLHIPAENSITRRSAYLLYERIAGYLTDTTIFVSHGEYETAKNLNLVRESSAIVIPNGVQRPRRIRAFGERGDFQVLYVGRANSQKNPMLALRIWDEFLRCSARPATLTMVGEGLSVSVGDEVRRLGLESSVQIVDGLPTIRPLLRSSHVLLSTSAWEGLPLAVLEAMSEATVPVLTDISGHREVVAPTQCGVLYDPGRPCEAAGALLSLSEEKTWTPTAAKAAQTSTDLFSSDTMAKSTAYVYQTLMSRRARRPRWPSRLWVG